MIAFETIVFLPLDVILCLLGFFLVAQPHTYMLAPCPTTFLPSSNNLNMPGLAMFADLVH